MSGHVFVVRGDLTLLACDALLVPTDAQRRISRWWQRLFPEELERAGDWLQVPVEPPPAFGRACRAFDTGLVSRGRALWLMETGVDDPAPEPVVDAVVAAVREAGASTARAAGRAKPLLGMPLVGTGAGGLSGQRGAVLRLLMQRLQEVTGALDVDVALVLTDARDFAAAQALRPPGAWDLSEELVERAERLGGLAASDGLSLFIGAGASIALGLPDWRTLVGELREAAGLPPECDDLPAGASEAAAVVGEAALEELVRARFRVEEHTLAHGLLAGLGARQVVTTNYDNAYELAHRGAYGERALHVMTRQVPGPGADWLLKLHGDAAGQRPLVLTREQYARATEQGAPLRGVVQSLLMTSHVVFVGYSMTDETFLLLASQVREALEGAEGADRYRGTALAIAPDAGLSAACRDDLEPLTMPVPEGATREGARLLEVFLDRVLWTASRRHSRASQYLLDDRYSGLLDDEGDRALHDRLLALLADVGPAERGSSGWPALAAALERLGADRDRLRP